jgi:DMSO/TMAO reductase YedYZ heme-binding membrane subunit
LYSLGLVSLSFYARRRLGAHAWRWIHALSFVAFLMALLHGVLSGTDSAARLVQVVYWGTGGSVLFLSLYRFLLGLGRRLGRQT